MSEGITLWIQRLFQRYVPLFSSDGEAEASNSEEREIPAVPTLPAERVHQLELAPENGDMMSACGSSAFFQRLPLDVRRLVLIEAFGGRTMHVDLQHRPRPGGGDVVSELRSAMSGMYGQAGQTRSWQWYGCVCHRDPEWRVRHRRIGDVSVSEPIKDRCIEPGGHDGAQECVNWSCEKPLKCRVGAMGWLRTCRQA